MDANGINNFKGVMLCSRPNENPGPVKKDIFCARVMPADQLGLVPTKKYDEIKVRKKKNPILNKHKKWLEEFKNKIASAKSEQQEAFMKEQERQQKIKEQADRQRERLRLGVSDPSQNNNDTQQKTQPKDDRQPAKQPGEASGKRHQPKGNEKPAWARTQEQIEKKQEQEADELLDFFTNTDIEKFIDEVEVNALLSTLKNKIEDIKKDKDWKENNRKRIKEQAKQQQQRQEDEDKKTQVSKGSVAKSVASEKSTRNLSTQSERIQELKEKLEKKKEGQDEWDKNTRTSKQSYVNIEERIAKNVADDLLRNYGNLKAVHSNVSVRKLLEREAARQLAESTAEIPK